MPDTHEVEQQVVSRMLVERAKQLEGALEKIKALPVCGSGKTCGCKSTKYAEATGLAERLLSAGRVLLDEAHMEKFRETYFALIEAIRVEVLSETEALLAEVSDKGLQSLLKAMVEETDSPKASA